MSRQILRLRRSALSDCGDFDGLRTIARLITVLLVAVIGGAFIVPWTQTAPGRGRVVAYSPSDRETPIRAPIGGRITRWLVTEGDLVEEGQAIAELADNDPNILSRLGQVRDATLSQNAALASAMGIAEEQVRALSDARDAGLELSRNKVRMAQNYREEKQQKLIAAQAKAVTAKLNLKRQRELNSKDLASDRELELAELAAATAESETKQARASLRAAEGEVLGAQSSLTQTREKNRASIEKARGELEKLRAEASKATASTAQAETRLSRQQQMTIVAPRTGRILSVVARQGSDFVKAGDRLAVLVPETSQRAVELWVDGNDAPLITKDRRVRLQFEGWPAVQFVGWPSVATGTFGGIVAFVDSASREDGKFRVMILPDSADQPWPDVRYLRQGVRTRGWVLLNRVSVAYELWRQFNGFPPTIEAPQEAGKEKG